MSKFLKINVDPSLGSCYIYYMRVISKKTLKDFWLKHPQAQQGLSCWYQETKKSIWNTPSEIRGKYRSADFLHGNRVVFNIGGNKYRLIVKINYDYSIVYVRFVGTYKEYDRINAEEV